MNNNYRQVRNYFWKLANSLCVIALTLNPSCISSELTVCIPCTKKGQVAILFTHNNAVCNNDLHNEISGSTKHYVTLKQNL